MGETGEGEGRGFFEAPGEGPLSAGTGKALKCKVSAHGLPRDWSRRRRGRRVTLGFVLWRQTCSCEILHWYPYGDLPRTGHVGST